MAEQTTRPGLPDPATIKSKGFTLRGAVNFVDARYGPGALEKALAQAPPDLREAVAGAVQPSAWYPFRFQVGLYEAIDRAFGRGDLALCREIGRYTAEAEANTFHKVLIKLASLKSWLKVAGSMWGMYYSAGQLKAEEMGDTGGTLSVSAFNPVSKAFCEDLAGWFQKTAEMSGKKDVTVIHVQCLLDGDPACLYRATWKE
jgi:predicted hydrocarbon binding protein